MNNKLLILGLLLVSVVTFATTPTDKQIDTIQNSTGGAVLTVPAVGTTFVTDTNTLSLSNKTLTSPVITGAGTLTTATQFVDTSDATKELAFLLSGNTTGKTLTLSTSQSLSETLAIPNVGSADTIATLKATQTFTSGSTWNGVAIGAGFGGTGASTLTAHNVLLGEGTSSVAFAAPTQYLSLIGNASGDPSFQAVPLNQTTAVTGQLAVSNGGTGASTLTQYGILMGNGTSAVTLIGPSSNTGYVLTSTGVSSAPTFQAVPSVAPTLNGTAASPQSVPQNGLTAITLTTPTYSNIVFIKSASSGTATITATPSITACTAAGQTLTIISESSTNLVTLQNQADLAGSQVLLNGPWTSGENNSTPNVLNLVCDGAGTPSWVETSRNN
jgi:hypothetical protein